MGWNGSKHHLLVKIISTSQADANVELAILVLLSIMKFLWTRGGRPTFPPLSGSLWHPTHFQIYADWDWSFSCLTNQQPFITPFQAPAHFFGMF